MTRNTELIERLERLLEGIKTFGLAADGSDLRDMAVTIAALRTQPAGVKVRGLEWGYDNDPDVAESVVGGYVATSNGTLIGYLPKSVNLGNYGTVDAAKDAAQADYERRIRSALEPAILSKQGGER